MSQSGMTPDQLQPEDTLEDRGVEDVLDEGYSPPERETDHLKHPEGGEDLEERLDDEEPEVWDEVDAEARQDDEASAHGEDEIIRDGDVGGEVGGERTGRLTAPDEGLAEDTEKDLVGQDEGIDGAGASAEEAAMHTIEEPDA